MSQPGHRYAEHRRGKNYPPVKQKTVQGKHKNKKPKGK